MSEDNRAELVRLIHEHLADKNLKTVQFVSEFPGTVGKRTIYTWISGSKVPGSLPARAALEDVLGWKPGTVREVVNAKPGTRFELSELRDWELLGEVPPPSKLSDFSTDEIVLEFSRRMGAQERENEYLLRRLAEYEREHSEAPRSSYGLAANSTDAARNMEHLED